MAKEKKRKRKAKSIVEKQRNAKTKGNIKEELSAALRALWWSIVLVGLKLKLKVQFRKTAVRKLGLPKKFRDRYVIRNGSGKSRQL